MSIANVIATPFSAADSFFVWLLFASCKGAAITAAVLLVTQLLKKHIHAQGKVLLWLLAAVAFAAPIGWQLNAPVSMSWVSSGAPNGALGERAINLDRETSQRHTTTMIGSENARLNTGSSHIPLRGADIYSYERTISMQQLAALVWLAGVLLLTSLLIANHLRFSRIARTARAIDPNMQSLFDGCRAELGVAKEVKALTTLDVQSPILFGVRSPTLLLPINFADEFSTDEIRLVFLHELAHVQRMDLAARWFVALVQILHWFNPFAWLMGQRLRCALESACDARVLQQLTSHERLAYGHALIRAAELPAMTPLVVQTGMAGNHAQLKERLQMIRQFKPSRSRSLLAWLALMLTAPVTLAQWNGDNVSPPRQDIEKRGPAKTTTHETSAPVKVAATPFDKPLARSNSTPTATNAPLRVKYFKIAYVNATDLQALIRPDSGISLLSARGSVAVDTRTNTLLVNDTDERLAAVRELIANIDVPLRRVSIDARLAMVDSQISRDLIARNQPAGTTTAATQRATTANLSIGYNADEELDAIQSARKGEVIASPRLITGNRKEATIKQGIAVASAGDNGNSQTVRLDKSILTITSRPVITPSDGIQLYVTIRRERAQKAPADSSANAEPGVDEPSVDAFQIGAESLLGDGQTFVAAIPARTHEPNENETRQQELLVFLTPTIVLEEANRSF